MTTGELDRLEAEVLEARVRLSGALERIVADAAPAAIGGSAARLTADWVSEAAGRQAVTWLRNRPAISIACVAGLLLVVGCLNSGPRTIQADGNPY